MEPPATHNPLNTFIIQPFAANTRKTYLKIITDFFNGELTWDQIQTVTAADIVCYLNQILASGKSNSTYNQHLAALSAFFNFMVNLGVLNRNPCNIVKSLPRRKESSSKALTTEEACKIFECIETVENPLLRLRDRAIFLLGIYGGLRRSEIANLCKSMMETAESEGVKQLVIKFKGASKSGDPDEKVIIAPRAWNALTEYLDALELENRVLSSEESIFRSLTKGGSSYMKPLSDRSIYNIVVKYARRAGIEGDVCTHTLRHSYGTIASENGLKDVKILQTCMRHADPSTTMRYVHNRDLLHNHAGLYIHI